MVFLGTFMASSSMTLFAWGTRAGWFFLALTFLTHVYSVVDGLKQISFPVFPSFTAWSATAGVLGAAIYTPLTLSLWLLAWPALSDRADALGSGYLVDRLAYRDREPSVGDWVWLGSSPGGLSQAGKIVAVAGHEVEWSGRRWRVNGNDLKIEYLRDASFYPEDWRFRVPGDHVVVKPADDTSPAAAPAPLLLVSRGKIVGRAWARCLPVWDRCLL